MTDFPVTVAKLLLVALSLLLMFSAVAALIGGDVATAVMFALLAVGVVAAFALFG